MKIKLKNYYFLYHRKKSKHPSKRKSHLYKNDKKDINSTETVEPLKQNLKKLFC